MLRSPVSILTDVHRNKTQLVIWPELEQMQATHKINHHIHTTCQVKVSLACIGKKEGTEKNSVVLLGVSAQDFSCLPSIIQY